MRKIKLFLSFFLCVMFAVGCSNDKEDTKIDNKIIVLSIDAQKNLETKFMVNLDELRLKDGEISSDVLTANKKYVTEDESNHIVSGYEIEVVNKNDNTYIIDPNSSTLDKYGATFIDDNVTYYFEASIVDEFILSDRNRNSEFSNIKGEFEFAYFNNEGKKMPVIKIEGNSLDVNNITIEIQDKLIIRSEKKIDIVVNIYDNDGMEIFSSNYTAITEQIIE